MYPQVRTFSEENNLPSKAILIVDNCPAHGKDPLESDDGQIILVFLPPNVTAILQPMDQGPIKHLKMIYRNRLLSRVVNQSSNTDESVLSLLKKHSIRDAIILLKEAWDDISTSTLKSCWGKVLDYDEDDYTDEDMIPISELMQNASVMAETQRQLEAINPDHAFTIEEIDEWNNDLVDENDPIDDASDSDEESGEMVDDAAATDTKTTHTAALNHLNELLKWCNDHAEYGEKHITALLNIRPDIDKAIKNQPTKQTTINDFFRRT